MKSSLTFDHVFRAMNILQWWERKEKTKSNIGNKGLLFSIFFSKSIFNIAFLQNLIVSFWCLAWLLLPSYEFMVYLLVTSRWSTPSAIRHPYSNMWINPVKIKAINLKMWLICKKLEVITIIKTVLISEASRVNFLCRTQSSSIKVEFSLGPSTGVVELKFVWGQASMESIWKKPNPVNPIVLAFLAV